jgi:ABC-type Fe3+/spermidine/putrescine transport system ATPase subunit
LTTWLACQGINKRLGSRPVLRDLELTASRGEIISILGPSGSGKTTLMRLIAGLSDPDSGAIEIAGRPVWNPAVRVKTEHRRVGLVFQDYAIWPHMTVADNVGFGLRLAGMARAERDARIRQALEAMHIPELATRFPDQLSGGQQQRVALARSLAARPELLLLDEPLSNLDAGLRENLRCEILDVIRTHGITAVYITHDQGEAMALGDKLAVIHAGRILQIGSPEELYYRPRSGFVASFLGGANLVSGEVLPADSGLQFIGDELKLRLRCGENLPTSGVAVLIRPEDAAPSECFPENTLRGHVRSCSFLGRCWRIVVAVAGKELRIDWPRRAAVAEEIVFSVAPERCTLVLAEP